MAMTNGVNFIEKHIEKIVLAAAAVFLVVVVLMVASHAKVLLMAAPKLGEPGKSYSPKEVDARLLESSRRLTEIADKAKPTPELPPDPLGEQAADFVDSAAVRDLTGIVWTRSSIPLEGRQIGPEDGDETVDGNKLMLVEAGEKALIDQPKTNAAREVQVLMRTQEEVDAGQPLYKYNEVIAIHGAALFRLGQLHKKWLRDLAGTAVTARLTVAVVEVERRERQAGGEWGAPTLISRITSDAVPLPPLPAYDGKNLQEVRLAIEQLAMLDVQESIVEPPYWDILGRDGSMTSWLINKPRTDVSDLTDVSSLPTTRRPVGRPRQPARTVRPLPPGGRRAEPVDFDIRLRPMQGRLPGGGGPGSPMGTGRPAGRGSGSYDAARRAADAAHAARVQRHAAGRGSAAERQAAERAAGAAEARRMAEARRRSTGGRTPSVRPPITARPRTTVRPTTYRPTGAVEPEVTNQVPTFQQQLDNPAGIVEVWFHDTRLDECVTYSYRVRLVVINPLLGLYGVVGDKADAEKVKLSTAWSAWSDPVTVERPTEFFVAEAGGGGMVPVDVFTMKWGQRVKQNFTIRQGEPIGGKATVKLWKLGEQESVDVEVDFATGAIAVDLAFGKKRPVPNSVIASSTTELLYLDVDGQLRTRTALADRESARYKKLVGEATWLEEGHPASPSGLLARPGATRPDRMSSRTRRDPRATRRPIRPGSRFRDQRDRVGGGR